jgi:hypothetical protein
VVTATGTEAASTGVDETTAGADTATGAATGEGEGEGAAVVAAALVVRFLGAATDASTGVGTATTEASAAGTSFLEATRLAFVVLGADVELIIPEEEELELIIIRTLLLSLNQFFSNFAVFF